MTRTYLIDNGEQYSDHSLCFVSTTVEREHVERLLVAVNGKWRSWHIIGTVGEPGIEWMQPHRAMTLSEFAHGYDVLYLWSCSDADDADDRARRDDVLAVLAMETPR